MFKLLCHGLHGRDSSSYRLSAGRLVGILLTLLLLAGCSDEPDAVLLRDQNIAYDRARVPRAAIPVGKALDLSDILQIALTYNLDTAIAAQEVLMQQEAATGAKLKMLPSLMLSGDRSHRNAEDASKSLTKFGRVKAAEPSFSTEKNRLAANVNLAWNVLDFGLSYFRSKQARSAAKAANERVRRVRQNMALEVIDTYWRAQVSAQAMALAQKLLRDTEKRLPIIQEQMKTENLPLQEGLEKQADLLESRVRLRRYENEFYMHKARLASMMGLAVGMDFKLARENLDRSFDIPSLDVELLEREALRSRPELIEQDYEEKIAAADVRIAITSMFPNANLFSRRDFDANRFLYQSTWYSVGMSTSLDLLSLPGKFSKKALAKRKQELVRKRRLALMIGVMTQLRLAMIEYDETLAEFKELRELFTKRAAIFREVEARYKAEEIDEERLIDAEARAFFARIRAYTAFAGLKQAQAKVWNTVGREPGDEVSDNLSAPGTAITRVDSNSHKLPPAVAGTEAPLADVRNLTTPPDERDQGANAGVRGRELMGETHLSSEPELGTWVQSRPDESANKTRQPEPKAKLPAGLAERLAHNQEAARTGIDTAVPAVPMPPPQLHTPERVARSQPEKHSPGAHLPGTTPATKIPPQERIASLPYPLGNTDLAPALRRPRQLGPDRAPLEQIRADISEAAREISTPERLVSAPAHLLALATVAVPVDSRTARGSATTSQTTAALIAEPPQVRTGVDIPSFVQRHSVTMPPRGALSQPRAPSQGLSLFAKIAPGQLTPPPAQPIMATTRDERGTDVATVPAVPMPSPPPRTVPAAPDEADSIVAKPETKPTDAAEMETPGMPDGEDYLQIARERVQAQPAPRSIKPVLVPAPVEAPMPGMPDDEDYMEIVREKTAAASPPLLERTAPPVVVTPSPMSPTSVRIPKLPDAVDLDDFTVPRSTDTASAPVAVPAPVVEPIVAPASTPVRMAPEPRPLPAATKESTPQTDRVAVAPIPPAPVVATPEVLPRDPVGAFDTHSTASRAPLTRREVTRRMRRRDTEQPATLMGTNRRVTLQTVPQNRRRAKPSTQQDNQAGARNAVPALPESTSARTSAGGQPTTASRERGMQISDSDRATAVRVTPPPRREAATTVSRTPRQAPAAPDALALPAPTERVKLRAVTPGNRATTEAQRTTGRSRNRSMIPRAPEASTVWNAPAAPITATAHTPEPTEVDPITHPATTSATETRTVKRKPMRRNLPQQAERDAIPPLAQTEPTPVMLDTINTPRPTSAMRRRAAPPLTTATPTFQASKPRPVVNEPAPPRLPAEVIEPPAALEPTTETVTTSAASNSPAHPKAGTFALPEPVMIEPERTVEEMPAPAPATVAAPTQMPVVVNPQPETVRPVHPRTMPRPAVVVERMVEDSSPSEGITLDQFIMGETKPLPTGMQMPGLPKVKPPTPRTRKWRLPPAINAPTQMPSPELRSESDEEENEKKRLGDSSDGTTAQPISLNPDQPATPAERILAAANQ